MDEVRLCKDCKHFDGIADCHAPENMEFDFVKGGQKAKHYASYARRPEQTCGPLGKLWEAK